jgi:hypothetical protein
MSLLMMMRSELIHARERGVIVHSFLFCNGFDVVDAAGDSKRARVDRGFRGRSKPCFRFGDVEQRRKRR